MDIDDTPMFASDQERLDAGAKAALRKYQAPKNGEDTPMPAISLTDNAAIKDAQTL